MRCTSALLFLFFTSALYANEVLEVVELKLLDALDETRGWCVDLFAHGKNAMPQGGFQGHTCFMYRGTGPAEDQGFDRHKIKAEGKFHLVYSGVCMTLHENRAGSFVGAEKCTDEKAQQFTLTEQGRIMARAEPELCLTLGMHSVPSSERVESASTPPPKTNDKIHLVRGLSRKMYRPER